MSIGRPNHMAPTPGMTVGDIDSDAKGSGARLNAGKPELDLVPVRFWLMRWLPVIEQEEELEELHMILRWLAEFQEGSDPAIEQIIREASSKSMASCVRVLEFGAKKYKAWNWAKGMPWSVCFGCILRHAQKIVQGENVDGDSGEYHAGHIMANVTFLAWYLDKYREGDDRPPSYDLERAEMPESFPVPDGGELFDPRSVMTVSDEDIANMRSTL